MTTYNATWIRRVAWSLDGTQMLQLVGHHGVVTSVAWSPDGTQLSTGSGSQGQGDGEELFLWDAQSGERVCTLAGHPGMVVALVGGAEWRVCAGTRGPSVHSAFAQGEFQWPLARHLRGERIHQHLGPGNWRASTHDATRLALRAPAFMHREYIILPNIMQVAHVLQDDKRAGQASLCRQTRKREERLKHKGKDKALERQHESDLVKRLEQLGIEVDVSPAVTTLTYEQIYTSGPTLEEALLTFLGEALSRYEALRTWKAHTMPIVTNGTDKHETQDL